MRACFDANQRWMTHRAAEVDTMVGGLRAQGDRMTEDQATNYLVFSTVMSCYRGIRGELVDAVRGGAHLSKEDEDILFRPPATPPRPTRQQYELLESVIKEEQLRRAKEQEGIRPVNFVGQGMSPMVQAMYASVVGVVVFGAGLWALLRIIRGARPIRERSEKATRRVARAEQRLKKKSG